MTYTADQVREALERTAHFLGTNTHMLDSNEPDATLLRDLAARLEQAYVGVLREEIPGKLVFEPDGAGQRVIVIEVEDV